MSVNTVRKYAAELEEYGLIVTEPTFIITGDGRKHNGTLRYTIQAEGQNFLSGTFRPPPDISARPKGTSWQ